VGALVEQVRHAVRAVDAVDLADRIALGVVEQAAVEAVRGEDHRALAGRGRELVGVQARLLEPGPGIDRGLLGLEHRDRLAVLAVHHVVGASAVGERDLLPDLLGVRAVVADVPAGLDEELIDQPAPGGDLVPRQGGSDGLALGAQRGLLVLRRARGLLGLALGLEALGALGLELGDDRLVARVGEAELLQGLAGLAVGREARRRRLIGRARRAVATDHGEVEPHGHVEGSLETVERHHRRQAHLAVDRIVAGLADQVHLGAHDLGHRGAEALVVHQVEQVGRERTIEAVAVVDRGDDELELEAQLRECALWIRVRVRLGVAAQVGEHLVLRAQELEVLRLHRRDLGARHGEVT
jgi:hypothetical protein